MSLPDPLMGRTLNLRLQTHLGDGIPVGLYTDTAGTIPARNEGDLIACWTCLSTGFKLVQANSGMRPFLTFLNGVPFVQFNGAQHLSSTRSWGMTQALAVVSWNGGASMYGYVVFDTGPVDGFYNYYPNGLSYMGTLRNSRVDGFFVGPVNGKHTLSIWSSPAVYTCWVDAVQVGTTSGNFNIDGIVRLGKGTSDITFNFFEGRVSSVFVSAEQADRLQFEQYAEDLLTIGPLLPPVEPPDPPIEPIDGQRTLHPDTRQALNENLVRLALLAYADFPSGPVRIWTGIGSLFADGHEWLGVGELLALEDITETVDSAQNGMSVRLSGIPSAIFTSITLGNYQNRKAVISLLVFNGDYDPVGAPVVLFRGLMDSDTVKDNGTETSVTINLESAMSDQLRPRIFRYTHEDQRTRYAGTTDKGLEYVAALQNLQLRWGQQ